MSKFTNIKSLKSQIMLQLKVAKMAPPKCRGHARNKTFFSSLIQETFFVFFFIKKFKLNKFLVQAPETQFL